jgi:hypothetical protein
MARHRSPHDSTLGWADGDFVLERNLLEFNLLVSGIVMVFTMWPCEDPKVCITML